MYDNGVTMQYNGTRRGAITLRSADRKRSYRVAAGWTGSVHPDDVTRFAGLGFSVVQESAPSKASKTSKPNGTGDDPTGGSTAAPEGYADMNVEETLAALEGMNAEALRAFANYEAANKNRVSVLREVEARIDAA